METKVRWTGYAALILIFLFFSGLFTASEGPLQALDFNNIVGEFGVLGDLGEGDGVLASSFRGTDGTGVRDGFLFALSLVPAVMFSLGIIKIVEYFDGLNAAEHLLSPLLRPLLGIPGSSGIALVASLQSADAGASMMKQMSEENRLDAKEKIIFCAFQFSAGAALTNFLGSGAALFPFLGNVPILFPLLVIFFYKILGANLMRLYLNRFPINGSPEGEVQI